MHALLRVCGCGWVWVGVCACVVDGGVYGLKQIDTTSLNTKEQNDAINEVQILAALASHPSAMPHPTGRGPRFRCVRGNLSAERAWKVSGRLLRAFLDMAARAP